MKNILLIGLGRFGKHVAYQLNELGHEVMAVDSNENLVNEILPYVTDAQIGDSTNENFLESLGIKNYDICFVTIGGNFQNSLETTSLLKELGAKMVISSGMYRQSSCFATEQTRSFIRKNRSPTGQRSAIRQIISMIISKWMILMLFLRWRCREAGSEKRSVNWISVKSTASVFWQSKQTER